MGLLTLRECPEAYEELLVVSHVYSYRLFSAFVPFLLLLAIVFWGVRRDWPDSADSYVSSWLRISRYGQSPLGWNAVSQLSPSHQFSVVVPLSGLAKIMTPDG